MRDPVGQTNEQASWLWFCDLYGHMQRQFGIETQAETRDLKQVGRCQERSTHLADEGCDASIAEQIVAKRQKSIIYAAATVL